MKKISNSFRKGSNWALAGLLSILGFSCSESDPNNDTTEEYGTPYATFEIKGKVQNKEGKEIPDIQIQIAAGRTNNSGGRYDTIPDLVKTDFKGEFNTNFSHAPVNNLKIIVTDTDKEANGSYLNKTEEINLESDDFVDGDKWYKGTAKKEITITLEEKKDN